MHKHNLLLTLEKLFGFAEHASPALRSNAQSLLRSREELAMNQQIHLQSSLRGSRMKMRLHEATSNQNHFAGIKHAVIPPRLRLVCPRFNQAFSSLLRPLLIASHERAPRNDEKGRFASRPYQKVYIFIWDGDWGQCPRKRKWAITPLRFDRVNVFRINNRPKPRLQTQNGKIVGDCHVGQAAFQAALIALLAMTERAVYKPPLPMLIWGTPIQLCGSFRANAPRLWGFFPCRLQTLSRRIIGIT